MIDKTSLPPYDFQAGETILIDKPYEWTSFDVVNKIRVGFKYKLGIKKIKVGHAGTLDPLATGLLIICTGKNTKRIEGFQALTKTYTGSITIGATRPSHDLETEIEETSDFSGISEKDIDRAIEIFNGEIDQTPPLHSAIKVEGRRAYDYTRKDDEVKLKTRKVTIHEFQVTSIHLPEIHFKIKCSKGTYIRSIARDLGSELGTGAYLSSLRRTEIGEYSVENALTVNCFQEMVSKMASNSG